MFESADLDSAVEGIVDAIWFNQGQVFKLLIFYCVMCLDCVRIRILINRLYQVCSAGSKVLVQEPVFGVLVEKLKNRMKKLRVGHSLDKCIDMAAVVDPSHLKTIKEFIQSAIEEGANVSTSLA